MEHVPELAAAEAAGPRRSLVLAGGGMRVAYQAGVLRALAEDGLRFFHADGASGGTINLAMLLSGVSPEEMCERWATLDVKDFVSLLPLRRYLRGPSQLAYGDADGLIEQVFPHLGIDVDRIRAARGIEGTFNVVDYGSKTNHAIPHTELDIDLLVAGVSLPIMLPPVASTGQPLHRLRLDQGREPARGGAPRRATSSGSSGASGTRACTAAGCSTSTCT